MWGGLKPWTNLQLMVYVKVKNHSMLSNPCFFYVALIRVTDSKLFFFAYYSNHFLIGIFWCRVSSSGFKKKEHAAADQKVNIAFIWIITWPWCYAAPIQRNIVNSSFFSARLHCHELPNNNRILNWWKITGEWVEM